MGRRWLPCPSGAATPPPGLRNSLSQLTAHTASKTGARPPRLHRRGVAVPHTHRDSSRFLLDLQVVPAAKEITHLPIVVDPSHATFWRPWVRSMSLASVASGCDGIMLEVHPDPTNSAVDPLQPINYKDFRSLINEMDIIAKNIYKKKILE